MGEVVNLRQARKQRVRQAAAEQASANRLRFGRTKEARLAEDAETARVARQLDQARREE